VSTGDDFIPFCKPSFEEEDIDALVRTIRSGWWTSGPRVSEFEEAFAAYAESRHAVAVSSCTAALHLSLESLGVSSGDLVFLPAYTFAATAEVILYSGAVPVFLDIERDSMNLDPAQLARALEITVSEDRVGAARDAEAEGLLAPGTARVLSRSEGRAAAVIPVHLAGMACEMDSILPVARRHQAAVVEDAAHAVETRYRQRKVGSIGDATAFSFYATKNLTTGEGGMVTTDDSDLAERVRRLSLHGISKDAWNRYTASGSWRYEVVERGFKYNMSDIAASLGLGQLQRIEATAERRREIVRRYTAAFSDVAAIECPRDDQSGVHAWHLYVVRLRPENLSIDRAEFIERMRERGIGTSVHFMPLHLHRFYAEEFGYGEGDFPVAEGVYSRAVSLPLYPHLTDAEVGRVCSAVREICAEHRT